MVIKQQGIFADGFLLVHCIIEFKVIVNTVVNGFLQMAPMLNIYYDQSNMAAILRATFSIKHVFV